ncbi:MAG: 4Fe-4S binding protein [Candidatus Thiodiazotropha sp.]
MVHFKELFERIRQEERLPDVISGRCVHTRVELASCSSCVDACPQRAWSLDDDALQLDTILCDGCGLCAPVCPEGAISFQYEILIGEWKHGKIALCACEEVGFTRQKGIIPCVHLIGIHDILKLYRLGYSEWLVATGNCSECHRNSGETFFERADRINPALSDDLNTTIGYRLLSGNKWLRISSILIADDAASKLSRRGFLRGIIDGGIQAASAIFKLYEEEADEFPPPGELLPERGGPSIWPYVPQIDAFKCNGCDACIRICPHGALIFTENSQQMFYRMEPQACTGCGICQDICNAQAISVMQWSQLDKQDLILAPITCSCCGNQAHMPVESGSRSQTHCRICAQVNHHNNLYQVME